jgi:oxygen-independent coproporphyrinogen-3 oxidase
VVCDKDKLTLTPAGVRLSRVVASVFDTYLRNSSVRHSIAV